MSVGAIGFSAVVGRDISLRLGPRIWRCKGGSGEEQRREESWEMHFRVIRRHGLGCEEGKDRMLSDGPRLLCFMRRSCLVELLLCLEKGRKQCSEGWAEEGGFLSNTQSELTIVYVGQYMQLMRLHHVRWCCPITRGRLNSFASK